MYRQFSGISEVQALGQFARGAIFTEGFDGTWSGGAPSNWSKSYAAGSVDWSQASQSNSGSNPGAAYSGGNFAYFFWGGYGDYQTYLISPVVDLSGYSAGTVNLSFMHYMENWEGDQDTLQVVYRSSGSDPWTLVPGGSFTESTATWTERSLTLPGLSSTYQVAFLGDANFGAGVALDALTIDVVPEPSTWLAAGFVGLLVAGRYGRILVARFTSRD